MKRIFGALSLLAIVLVIGWVSASLANSAQNEMNKQDHKFIKEAASGGKMEVELGQVAAKQASSPEVKSFAEQLVKDHSTGNMKLMRVAEKESINLPKGMEHKHQQMLDHLSKLKGTDFDREYMKHMVEDHIQDIQSFQQETREGKNPGLVDYARNELSTLEEHLKMAKEVNGDVEQSS